MKITNLLGDKARTFIEWVENQPKFSYTETTDHFAYNVLKEIRQAQQFLSQPFDIELAKEIFIGFQDDNYESIIGPVRSIRNDKIALFKDGRIKIGRDHASFCRVFTIDDLIRETSRKDIELFYNKEYEI